MNAFLLTCLLSITTAAPSGAPYITHVVDAAAGDTMIVSGGGYDPESVRVIMHVPGNLTSQRDDLDKMVPAWAAKFTGRFPGLPEVPPAEKTMTMKPLHASERSVFVKLPSHPYPPRYTAVVWLQDGERRSRPILLNRPAAWFLLKTTSRPGEKNRLCGMNLRGDRYAKRFLFLRKRGGEAVLLDEVARHREDGVSEAFCFEFRLPGDITPGDYEVFAHSNSGGPWGFTEPLPLTVTPEPSFPTRLIPATEHGVVADSMTDNRQSLQSALDEAGNAGGVVLLPPGQCRIDDTIQIPADVILRGAGRDATTLFYGGAANKENRARWLISARGVDHTGIEDLTVRVAPPFDYAVSYYAGGEPSYDTHLKRCRFIDGTVGVGYNIRMEIANCCFEGGTLHATNLRNSWVHDNEFTRGRFGGNPVSFWAAENCVIEHNRAYKSNRGFVWQSHGQFGHYHNLIDANVVEDARMGGNAGETYLFEGGGLQWVGTPSDATADAFSIPKPSWEEGQLVDCFAVVVAGRGVGQYRRIAANTATHAVLERPWRVTPSGDVRISILRGVVENAITNNRHVDCDNSMMFYGCGMLNNRIVRNRSENSLGISVWSLSDRKTNRLLPDYYNIFDGNVFEYQGGVWMTRMGDVNQAVGVRTLNNVFRNNFLADVRRKRENQYYNVWEQTTNDGYRPIQAALWCDTGRNYQDESAQGPIWIDTLIERNYITRCDRGVELQANSKGAVVYNNTFFDVRTPLLDNGEATLWRDNREEYPEP